VKGCHTVAEDGPKTFDETGGEGNFRHNDEHLIPTANGADGRFHNPGEPRFSIPPQQHRAFIREVRIGPGRRLPRPQGEIWEAARII